jgi:hypothetical protein
MSINVDPKDLVSAVIEGQWDLSSLELRSHNLEICPNIISWMTQPKFGGFEPWPRQIEFGVNLFEDYCPDCSNMSTVKCMWGMTLDEILRDVMLLNHGVCPNCGQNRNDFRRAGKHFGKHELVGVAGQRCLAPHTLLVRGNGSKVRIENVEVNDILMDQNGTICRVTKKFYTAQIGFFKINIQMPNGNLETIECGDSHTWITNRGDILSTSLVEGDLIRCTNNQMAVVRGIERERRARLMYDLETTSNTFLHASGLILHNSGKTAITAVFCTYLTHRFATLNGIACDNYGLRNTVLHGTFVAADLKQVSETTWGMTSNEIRNSAWFKQYFEYLKDEGKRLGTSLYQHKSDFLWLANKRILLSYRAGNKRGLRGTTRIIGAVDELGLFESSKQALLSGPEIYTSLSNQLQTIRSNAAVRWSQGAFNLPSAYMFSVSSPMEEDDPIMSLAANSKQDPQCYIFHLPTWEINPNITLESMKAKMEKDPVATMRDFGAQPSTGRSTFISNPEIIEAVINDQRVTSLSYYSEVFEEIVKERSFYYVRPKLQDCSPLDRTRPFVLACDAGEVNNSYAMALMGLSPEGYSVVYGLIQIKPRAYNQKLASVHFPSAENFISDLSRHLPLEMVLFDRWNSTDTVQRLRSKQIEALRYSLKYQDFKDLKLAIQDKHVDLPKPEVAFRTLMLEHISEDMITAQFCKQLRTVRDTGRRLTKPELGDDDLFRCFALGHWALKFYKERFDRNLYGAGARGMQTPIGMPSRITSSDQGRSLNALLPGRSATISSVLKRRTY